MESSSFVRWFYVLVINFINSKLCSSLHFVCSGHINEVIKTVLIFLFFYEKIWHAKKALKALKVLRALKVLNGTKTLKKKHKNVNKRIRDYFYP